MKKKTIILSAAVFLFTTGHLFSQTKGFAFLRHASSAREAALNGAFMTTTNDPTVLFVNPAALANIKEQQAAFSYADHLVDFSRGSGLYLHPREKDNLAVSFNFQDYGTFEGRDALNEPMGDFAANNFILQGTYASQYTEAIWYGANLKYFRSEIEDFAADGFALDASLYYQSPLFDNMKFALGIYNFGSVNSQYTSNTESLPTSVQLGISKVLAHMPFQWSVALRKYLDDDFQASIGGEFTVNKNAFIRIGYISTGSDQKVVFNGNRLAGFSGGLGVALGNYHIDYAYSSYGALGGINWFTLGFKIK